MAEAVVVIEGPWSVMMEANSPVGIEWILSTYVVLVFHLALGEREREMERQSHTAREETKQREMFALVHTSVQHDLRGPFPLQL